MRLQLYMEVDVDEFDAQTTALIYSEQFSSLGHLVSWMEEQSPKSVIVIDGARVILENTKMYCPICLSEMDKMTSGPWLFTCPCGHAEGRVDYLRVV